MSKNTLQGLYRNTSGAADYAAGVLERVVELCRAVDGGAVEEIVARLEAAIERDATVFLIGNGGCSALASHLVDDLSFSARGEGKPIRALSLTDNVASLTCIANDGSFDDVFSTQLRQHRRPKDVVFALSVSGNSANIRRAVEYAKAEELEVLALTGFDGGWLHKNAHAGLCITSTADEYGPVQDVMSAVLHIISSYLTQRRGLTLDH